MKNTFLYTVIFLFLVACDNLKETPKMDEALRKVIASNDCLIALTSEEIGSSKKLTLKCQCKRNDIFFPGKVLYDFYALMMKEKVIHNNYQILDFNGHEVHNFTRDELKSIVSQKKQFDNDLLLLTNKKHQKFYDNLSDELRKTYDYDYVTKYFDTLLKDTYPTFRGFIISELENQKFVTFSNSNGSNYVSITYNLYEKKNIINGFTIE